MPNDKHAANSILVLGLVVSSAWKKAAKIRQGCMCGALPGAIIRVHSWYIPGGFLIQLA